jgi:benzoyl-CoA reductase subunit C
MTLNGLHNIIEECKALAFDLDFAFAKNWKSKAPDRVIIGYMPVYFPREIVHAVNGLAVGILGAGDRKQIIKGDAFYQSYICHIPRSIIELALDNHLDGFDGFIFPSICDVIRNLSGMFQILNKGQFVKYLDYPQNFRKEIGGLFYIREINHVLEQITKINKKTLSVQQLNESIRLFNRNRRLIEEIYSTRQNFPWRITAEELYYIIRAGMVIPVEKHNQILETVSANLQEESGEPMDKIKVIVTGAFCEQPPVGLIKTIETAGCYIVDDDFLSGSRWIEGDIDCDSSDPLAAITNAYLERSRFSASVYSTGSDKGDKLIELAVKRNADGIIFAAPSFCDPALFDVPIFQKSCEKNGLRYISFQYSENTGQFKVIKEQVGAFSDSIKLWEDSLLSA